MPAKIDIEPLGDRALLLRLPDNAGAVKAQHQLEAAGIAGLVECAAAYETVGLFLDYSAAGQLDLLIDEIRTTLSRPFRRRVPAGNRIVGIDVSFDPEFAVDLDRVAEHAQLSGAEVITRFCRAQYRVACLGFTPGFPYLSGLPVELSTPRRSTPRREVPAGAVAIGGRQAGIYPAASPGGWNIIGRTNLQLFDPTADPPAALTPGDRVQFRAITREEYQNRRER